MRAPLTERERADFAERAAIRASEAADALLPPDQRVAVFAERRDARDALLPPDQRAAVFAERAAVRERAAAQELNVR